MIEIGIQHVILEIEATYVRKDYKVPQYIPKTSWKKCEYFSRVKTYSSMSLLMCHLVLYPLYFTHLLAWSIFSCSIDWGGQALSLHSLLWTVPLAHQVHPHGVSWAACSFLYQWKKKILHTSHVGGIVKWFYFMQANTLLWVKLNAENRSNY